MPEDSAAPNVDPVPDPDGPQNNMGNEEADGKG